MDLRKVSGSAGVTEMRSLPANQIYTTFLIGWSSCLSVRSSVIREYIFFQAEDGIRDLTVTGVQTCALPILVSLGTYAADACKHRGELDTMYCDDNNDLVADAPTDAKKWKSPSTIVFTYTDRKSVV